MDIFTEMHFQPSYRTQEGPRILPPPDSVPITGKEIEYKSVEEYQAMEIPSGIASESETLSRARQDLSMTNCMVCHGSEPCGVRTGMRGFCRTLRTPREREAA